ncbi:MAG: arginine deiminase-related protein, partial [Pirellulales bacterium]
AEILMCPPDFFGIEYEINPWMSRSRPSDAAVALRQWVDLRRLIEEAGANVGCLTPVSGLPDLVFTANAAMIYRDKAVLARFRHPQRQLEQPHDEVWLATHSFEVIQPPQGMYFEGAGDALFCGETLFAGYRIRSDARGHQEIGAMLGVHTIPLELVDPYYYHLDTCLCPLAPGVAIWYPGAFDSYAQRVLPEYIADLITVDEEEARHFACNAVVIGRTVLTNVGCPELHRELRSRGFEPRETPLGEFVKSGGSAKCLTLRLDGEEAAAWKHLPG